MATLRHTTSEARHKLRLGAGVLVLTLGLTHPACSLQSRGELLDTGASAAAGDAGEAGWGGAAAQSGAGGSLPDASAGAGGYSASGGAGGSSGGGAGGASGEAGTGAAAGGSAGAAAEAGAGGSPIAGGAGTAGAGTAGAAGISGADAGTARVTNGLIALYELNEAAGTIAADSSGVDPPLELKVPLSLSLQWIPGGLRLSGSTIIPAATAPDKLKARCSASNQISIEAWLAPADLTQGGPARIVTLSLDPSERLFTLGQEASSAILRVRTTQTTINGSPQAVTTQYFTSKALQHVVCTRDAQGNVSFYRDAQFLGSVNIAGDIAAAWLNAQHTFALGNELTMDRPWRGDLHLVALYDRALQPSEVLQNYKAGADP